jgi:hypothetical protein
MKHIKLLSFIIFLCILSQTKLQAQESVSPSGGNATGTNGSMSYTVGQVFYSAISGTNNTLTEGVQQPYEIFHVTSSHDVMKSSLTVLAYPNPTTDHLLLEIENPIKNNLRYQLFNGHGQLLSSKTISSFQTIISIGNYIPAIYYLKIFQKHKEITSFKIIKQ